MLHQFKIYHEYEMQWKNSLPFDESGGITPCNPWIASAKTPWWAALWGVTYENKKKWKKVNLCIEAEEYYFQSFLQCKNIWGGGYSSYFPYPP